MKFHVCKLSKGSGGLRFCVPLSYHWAMLALLLWLPTASAETVTIPAGAETQENRYNIGEPFSRPGNIVSQQIYSPSLFPVISAPGQLFQLNSMAFRLSTQGSGGGDSTASFDRVEILISSSTGPFSTTLAQNHGQNLIVVYDQAVTLRGIVPAGTTPSSFDIDIPFSTPFLYSPSEGALVVEVRKYGPEGLSVLGGADINGVIFYSDRGLGVQTFNNMGLETQFSYQAVPEPNTCLILFGGLILLQLAARKRC